MQKRTPFVLILLLLAGCASGAAKPPQPEPLPVTITLKHGDEPERQTQAQLERLLRTYDVRPWIFTDEIAIERDVIPHSHPVLTLSTQKEENDELLLSTFVHEQLHWFLESRPEDVEKAVADLKTLFPEVPVGYPDGARSEYSTYLHLLDCTLEDDAMRRLLGESRARQVLEALTTSHYRWIYRQVLERGGDLRGILAKYRLDPLARPPQAQAVREPG